MALPNLPGNHFSKTIGQRTFHKSHHFDVSNDIGMWVGEPKPGIGGVPLPGQKMPHFSVFPPGDGEALPSWVAFDKRVLAFDGYFEEVTINKNREEFRVRPVKIYFYLEDDTVQVNEPLVENSGLAQGVLIRRHRIPLVQDSEKFFTADAFNVGNELTFYGRKFTLTDCDKFTFNFLTKMGVKVGQSCETPVDEHVQAQARAAALIKAGRPYEKIDTFAQFLEHDREVLRFDAYWDDTDSAFGDVHQMVLHYYLADDTVEVREVYRPNAGRDTIPVFLQRGKLPRQAPAALPLPGKKTPRTVLNVCRTHHILDSLKTGAVDLDFYSDADLRIGSVINIYGRPLKLVGCDEFTKKHYTDKYGVADFASLENKAIPKPAPPVPKVVHPYNGFGSQEDSLANSDSLLPKAPQKDFLKFMAHDRTGLDSNVLRFVAQMQSENSVDSSRRFIISFFLADDTVSVFEPPMRNSGVIGGKFLERRRAPKTNSSQYLASCDFYVGATIILNRIPFTIIGADDYALKYMESNGYQVANLTAIEAKAKAALESADINSIKGSLAAAQLSDGSVPFETLVPILSSLGLNNHEILTIGRSFAAQGEESGAVDKYCRLAQEKLKKRGFDDFTRLLAALSYEDISQTGRIEKHKVENAVLAFKIPLSKDLLQILIASCTENGETEYAKFISLINFKENPCSPCTADDFAPQQNPPVDVPIIERVNFNELFAKLAV